MARVVDRYGTETSPGDYGGGGGGSSQAAPSQPTQTTKGKVTTYTDPEGRVHVREDYSAQGGGVYDTVVSGFTGGYAGSGFQKEAETTLSQPNVQAQIVKEATQSPAKAQELEQAGLIRIIPQTPGSGKPPSIRPLIPPYLPQYESPFSGFAATQRQQREGLGLTTYPLYESASRLSAGGQAKLESWIGYGPEAHPVIKGLSGFGSVFTGLPAYGAASLVGLEYTVRKPIKGLTGVIPGAIKTGGELITQAREKPFESAGMLVGLYSFGKGVKYASKYSADLPKFRSFIASEEASVFRKGQVDPWAKQPTMRESALKTGVEWKPKEIKASEIIKPYSPSVGEFATGKQGLIAVMEPPKQSFKAFAPAKVSRAGAYVTEEVTQYRTGLRGYIRPVEGKYKSPDLLALSRQRMMPQEPVQIQVQKPVSIAKTSQFQGTVVLPVTKQRQVSIQKQVQLQRMITPQIQISRQITKQTYITPQIQIPRQISPQRGGKIQIPKQILPIIPIQPRYPIKDFTPIRVYTPRTPGGPYIFRPPKFKGDTSYTPLFRIKGKRRRRSSKFPEWARIATPKQVMRGFRL